MRFARRRPLRSCTRRDGEPLSATAPAFRVLVNERKCSCAKSPFRLFRLFQLFRLVSSVVMRSDGCRRSKLLAPAVPLTRVAVERCAGAALAGRNARGLSTESAAEDEAELEGGSAAAG